MKTWFKSKNIQVLDWPSRSFHLNPIENLWSNLAQHIHSLRRQDSTELRFEIEDERHKTVPLSTIPHNQMLETSNNCNLIRKNLTQPLSR